MIMCQSMCNACKTWTYHVQRGACLDVARSQGLVVGQLTPTVDETDLLHVYALLFLQHGLQLQNLTRRKAWTVITVGHLAFRANYTTTPLRRNARSAPAPVQKTPCAPSES